MTKSWFLVFMVLLLLCQLDDPFMFVKFVSCNFMSVFMPLQRWYVYCFDCFLFRCWLDFPIWVFWVYVSELSWAAGHVWRFIFMFINRRKDSNRVHVPTLGEKINHKG